MPYTVTWRPKTRSKLASLWMQTADKKAVSAASNRIDQLLAVIPLSIGTVHGRYRRLVLGPLEVV